MENARLVLLLLHVLGFAALVGGLLVQLREPVKRVNPLMRDGSGTAVVAGPTGGGEHKPIGLVHFAVATADGTYGHEARFGDIGRDAVRMAAVRRALEQLLIRLG